MNFELESFPLPITDALIASLHEEMKDLVRAELAAEMPGLAEADIEEITTGEIGRGFDLNAYRGGFKKTYVRDLYAAAMLLTQPYAPTSYREFAPDIRAWLRRAGEAIHEAGGVPLMQHAFYAIREQLGHAIPLSRTWDGVGTWRH